ncbi:hypothetical protein UPYG_G00304440 [Umbra pygmaea]|uniref:Uncharacterized protein n=1 Tax=Umbra pygmaea TaxID=75934 RepID=A0ABD0VYD1_UMBPY
MSAEEVSWSDGFISPGTVPVEHLDYSYIEKCADVKYLEKILRVLRSGQVGMYSHLTEFCEHRLENLCPKSHALRKDNLPATAACFTRDEWSQIIDDLQKWEEDTKMSENEHKQQTLVHDLRSDNIPPVRGSNCAIPLSQVASITGMKRRLLPRDYREWDKFDVETECEKIDGHEKTKDPPAIINTGRPQIKRNMDTTALTQQEKIIVANREKDKGNEAFKASLI